MSDRQSSVVGAMGTVWFIVFSVWCFLEGHTGWWLVGVGGGVLSAAVTRAILIRYTERKK